MRSRWVSTVAYLLDLRPRIVLFLVLYIYSHLTAVKRESTSLALRMRFTRPEETNVLGEET
jgi:hypothetical protein